MDIINVGQGPRWPGWLEVIHGHVDVRSISVVSPDGRPAQSAAGVRSYATLESARQELKAGVVILTGTATRDRRQAVEALEQGLDIILDQPDTLALAALPQLISVVREEDRSIVLAQEDATGATVAALHSLLGKVGVIGHVSFIDRRPQSDLGEDVTSGTPYRQLIRFGLDHLENLCSMLGVPPRRVMARCAEAPWSTTTRSSTTEVLFELENKIPVQYCGSTASSHREQSLWIEGTNGSLRSDGAVVWWRKRGWPRFVPWRWRPKSTPNVRRRFTDAARRSLNLIQQMSAGGASADKARHIASTRLVLLGAIISSDQECRVVDVAAWTRSGGPSASLVAAGA